MSLDRARNRGRGLEVAEPPLSALSAANEAVARGYYAPTTLSAVDADLAVGNIKSGVTIFGFLGTYLSPLSEDLKGSSASALTSSASVYYVVDVVVVASGETDLASTTNVFSANSMQVAVASCWGYGTAANSLKLRVYMDGVSGVESGFVSANSSVLVVVGTKAMTGSKICKATLHNYNEFISVSLETGVAKLSGISPCGGGTIGVGSIKAIP